MRKPRVLLAGGGTGGHIFPLVALVRSLENKGADIAFIGPEEFPLDVLREESIVVKTIIPAGKLRRYFSFKTILEMLKLPIAFFQSLFFIHSWKPNVILGKGGYGSIAPIIAAKFMRIPIILHESDVFPGLANRTLARFAEIVIISFVEAKEFFPRTNTLVMGNPSRTKFISMERRDAKKILDLETRRSIIFVIGGSQGSTSINRIIEKIAPQLLKRYALIVSTGNKNTGYFKKVENQKVIVVRKFLNEEELAAAYTLADLVISRSGAGGIFETALFGKASIIIPLEMSAGDHQLKNAKAYEENGATLVLEEKSTNEQVLMFSIDSILQDNKTKERMSVAAKKFSRPKSAEKIAQFLVDRANNQFWSKITNKVR